MNSNLMDLGSVIKMRDCIAGLTKLDFAVYDHSGHLLIPPIFLDPIIEAFSSSELGKKEQKDYLKGGIKKALIRKSPSMFKGPMNQYHYFIPFQFGDAGLILVGNAFYSSVNDLEEFFASKGYNYGLSTEHIKLFAKKIIPSDIKKVSETYENIYQLFNLSVKGNYEKNIHLERYRKIMTIMELFSEIEKDISDKNLYNLLADAIIFLFGGDTVSIMVRTNERFIPVLTTGSLKKQVESVSLGCTHSRISDVLKNHRPFVCTDTVELLRIGYPDDITSIYLFPFSVKDETFGLLGVFNSQFPEDDIETISRMCSFAAFLLNSITSQKMFTAHLNSLTTMNSALNLNPTSDDTDTIYESIVEVSSKLMNAEKVSLMLPEQNKEELFIKAVKGINKWIAKNIRVKVGDGIAGKVYKEGKPIMVSDIEKNLSTKARPNYKTNSFVSIPLRIGDETIGVLNLADKVSGEVFSESDMEFLRYFASYASIAIKGAHYFSISEQMKTLSITDSLTELFNRRYFDDRLFEELQRAIRYDSVFSLVIFDIDDFKLFNDTEGHVAGDEILNIVADISRKSIRSIDILARFGGDEFAIIMPQTERDEAFLMVERVRKNIKELMPISWKNFPHEKITVSIGIATFAADLKDAKSLIKNADRALYMAKVSGKDRTMAWEAADPVHRENPSL